MKRSLLLLIFLAFALIWCISPLLFSLPEPSLTPYERGVGELAKSHTREFFEARQNILMPRMVIESVAFNEVQGQWEVCLRAHTYFYLPVARVRVKENLSTGDHGASLIPFWRWWPYFAE